VVKAKYHNGQTLSISLQTDVLFNCDGHYQSEQDQHFPAISRVQLIMEYLYTGPAC